METRTAPATSAFSFPAKSPPPSHDDINLVWEPRAPEDPSQWLDILALMDLVQAPAETAMEAKAKEQAIKRYRLERPRWQENIEDLYLEGRLTVGREPIHLQLDLARRLSLETFLEPLVHELMSRRHPHFRTIAPKIAYYSDQSTVQLIEHLYRPGFIKESDANRLHLGDALHGLALPMGLAEKKGSQFLALWDPERSELIKAFLQALDEKGDLHQAKVTLQEGPWGLPQGLLHFLIWTGIAQGHFSAYRKGEELPPGKISLYNLGSLDDLRPREALEVNLLHRLSQHPFFNTPNLVYSGLTLQGKLWERAKSQVESSRSWIREPTLKAPNFWKPLASVTGRHLTVLTQVQKGIDSRPSDDREGLMWADAHLELLKHWCEASAWVKEQRRLDKAHGQDLERLLAFLRDEGLEHLPEGTLKDDRSQWLGEWQKEGEPPLLARQVEDWMKGAEDWTQTYRRAYRDSHHQRHTPHPDGLEDWISRLRFKGLRLPELEERCERALERELQFKAECRCGHRLGDEKNVEAKPWANILLKALEPTLRDHPRFPELSSLCRGESYQEADRLCEELFKEVAPPEEKPIRPISLDQLLGKGQVMNKKSMIEELEKKLPDDPEQQYRIEP